MSLAKIIALQEEFRAIHDKMAKDGKMLIEQAFKDFFATNPEVSAIYWQQYTPYFNDGDICEFGVYEFDIDATPSFDIDKALEFERAIVKNELFKVALGDHKAITATANGLKIEKCDHD